MKFISKSSNLHIILRAGLPAQPITGTPATATVSVRFHDGMANVDQEELVKLMLSHPGFNVDFIAADQAGTDPYAYLREDSEPAHVLTEMKYGHPVGRNAAPTKTKLPPEVLKMIQDQAAEIAKQMLPSMVATALKEIVENRDALQSKVAEASEVTLDHSDEPKSDGRIGKGAPQLREYWDLAGEAKKRGRPAKGVGTKELRESLEKESA